MRKALYAVVTALVAVALAACGANGGNTGTEQQQQEEAAGFAPALDTQTTAEISIAGSYSNFEALEAEFDRFREYYPNVDLSYVKLDDYNNVIGTTLDSSSAPDIYVNYAWMYGREAYDSVFAHAENLAEPALGLDLDCLRPGLLAKQQDGSLDMVPVFSTTHGMLVNEDLFEQEGLEVPTTYAELVDVCKSLRDKGYGCPVLGYDGNDSAGLPHQLSYSLFCASVADDAEAVAALNQMEAGAGEYLRPALEVVASFVEDGCTNLDVCKPSCASSRATFP